jgi:hypothetical protein
MRALSRLVPLAAVAASTALIAAGCGGSSPGSASTATTAPPATTGTGTAPLAHAPEPTTPTPTPTNPNTDAAPAPTTPTTPGGTTPGATTPEKQPGGAGDEQPVRVPATFTVRGGKLTPATITVPPFLAVQVTVLAADGKAHTVLLRTPKPETLRIAAGQRAGVRLAGLRAGRYAVELDGRAAGTLVAGGEGGP